MKRLLLLLSISVLISCSASKMATQADADRGAKTFPGLTLEELNQGKIDFEQNCATCHKLKEPASKTEEQWRKIVPGMVKKANKKAGSEVIDVRKEQSILRYVVTMSGHKK